MKKFVAALVCGTTILITVAAGCSNEPATPVDTSGATASPSPSNRPATPTATHAPPEAASPSPSVAGDVKLGDVSEFAAAVATAVASGDVSALVRMAVTRPMACVAVATPENVGPVCRDGDPVGTSYGAFPFAVCSGGWIADLDRMFANLVDRAGAPAILARLASPPAGWPYGREVLVFRPRFPDQLIRAVAVYMEAGSIVSVQDGCRTTEGFVTFERPMPEVVWRSKPVP